MHTQQAIRRGAGGFCAGLMGFLVVLLVASAGRSVAAGDELEQECVEAALKKPKLLNVGVLEAGRYAKKDQAVFLHARYEAMPEGCRDRYLRTKQRKSPGLLGWPLGSDHRLAWPFGRRRPAWSRNEQLYRQPGRLHGHLLRAAI